MHWSIVELDEAPFELLTSDRPVIITNLAQPDTHILLPIGPHRLFVAVQDRKHSRWLRSRTNSDLVTLINKRVVGNASRLVYASNESQSRFIFNRFGKDRVATHLERLQAFREERRQRLPAELQNRLGPES